MRVAMTSDSASTIPASRTMLTSNPRLRGSFFFSFGTAVVSAFSPACSGEASSVTTHACSRPVPPVLFRVDQPLGALGVPRADHGADHERLSLHAAGYE